MGFRLSTLPRLLETRANKPRMTFLHYAVDLASKQPGCLDFVSELDVVHEAARFEIFKSSIVVMLFFSITIF